MGRPAEPIGTLAAVALVSDRLTLVALFPTAPRAGVTESRVKKREAPSSADIRACPTVLSIAADWSALT